MRNLLSSLFFILIFVGLGAMAFAAAPRGQEAAQPAAEVQAQEPAAPEAPTANNWSSLALPLETNIVTADNLAYYVETGDPSDSSGSGILWVYAWDETQQKWIKRLPGDAFGFGDPNFDVFAGDSFLIQADSNLASTSVAFVGDVPGTGTVVNSIVANGWNYIMIPLDQYSSYGSPSNPVGTADDLAADIGGVSWVYKWDSSQQKWIKRLPGDVFGFGDPDFNVYAGYPYLIQTDGTAPSQWP